MSTYPVPPMKHALEGVALDRRPRVWSWLLAYAALSLVRSSEVLGLDERVATSLALALCVAAGAAWQVLSRRDVADRLVVLSTLIVVAIAAGFFPGSETRAAQSTLAGTAGLVAGLVMAEHWLRRADRRCEFELARGVAVSQS